MIDGIAGRPFSAETLPPFTKPERSHKEKIIKVSQERYGTPRKIVEAKIVRWSKVFEESALPSSPKSPSQRSSQKTLYDARCVSCGKWTKVVFKPDGVRPVYCKKCLKKMREGSPQRSNRANSISGVPSISLKEATDREPTSFFSKKNLKKGKASRKKVNLKELREALNRSLDKNSENN
jgi:CxxC-x17-CxxC domain-containing protein